VIRSLPANLNEIFAGAFRQLSPSASLPEIQAAFYPFVGVKNTIRRRENLLQARISDQLEAAPEEVLHALAHLLLAKVYRRQAYAGEVLRYRQFVASHDMNARAHAMRQARGRKRITSPQGDIYHLEEIFDDLNRRFFQESLQRPRITWSAIRSRRRLGHYDSAHHVIVVSRIFDHHTVPRYAVEYILYHEMLHLKHPVKLSGSRRCVHGKEFQADEKRFPRLEQAKAFLKTL
jgi:predicted metal-dependent hydrolase